MAFVELKDKVTSVRNTIDSLIDEIIDLSSQVMCVSILDRSEGLRLLNYLTNMRDKIIRCQSTVDVVTARIHGMQGKSQYLSQNEANQLESDKHGLTVEIEILLAKYNEAYLGLVQKNIWANFKDTWEQVVNRTNAIVAKVIIWSFTSLVSPLLIGKNNSSNLLSPSRSFWERIFKN